MWDSLKSSRAIPSEIIVDEAMKFITTQAKAGQPFFTVIWYGTPHDPFRASDEDKAPFSQLDRNSEHQHGELVAMDRSIGTLRRGLRDLGVANNTIVWFLQRQRRPGTQQDQALTRPAGCAEAKGLCTRAA